MIRHRRGIAIASGDAERQFGPLWKFRVIVTLPPGETIAVAPVLQGQAKRAYVFGPGDSGWIELEELHQLRIAKDSGGSTATVELWWADEKEDHVYPAPAALATSPVGSVLYDSGSVAAGAAIDSGVLDLSTVGALGVFVDNTAGTVLRDLSLLSYLADGSTLIDTAVIRRCAFGTAPAGSVYAPGAIRGTIGANPPGGTSGTHVLYDATTAAGGALDSGGIFCEDADQVVATFIAAGAAGAANTGIREVDDAGVDVFINNLSAPGINAQTKVAWARGSLTTGIITGGGANNPAYYFSARRVRITGTGGAASTVRLILTGHGRVPGTFSHQMVLPTRARLQLGAGGAGAARLTVIAR